MAIYLSTVYSSFSTRPAWWPARVKAILPLPPLTNPIWREVGPWNCKNLACHQRRKLTLSAPNWNTKQAHQSTHPISAHSLSPAFRLLAGSGGAQSKTWGQHLIPLCILMPAFYFPSTSLSNISQVKREMPLYSITHINVITCLNILITHVIHIPHYTLLKVLLCVMWVGRAILNGHTQEVTLLSICKL